MERRDENVKKNRGDGLRVGNAKIVSQVIFVMYHITHFKKTSETIRT